MKKSILLIFLIGFINFNFAQLNQTELTPILQDAKDFAEKINQEGFEYSIDQFATWLNVNTLKPQSLTQSNRLLLIDALKSAFKNGIIKNSTKNLTLLFEFLKYESENGDDSVIWSWLGYIYFEGIGITKNYFNANYWFEKAALLGDEYSMLRLGWSYEKGYGVSQNYSNAIYWYEKAAEKGDAEVTKYLGDIYFYAKGVEKNYITARYWYEKGANLGEASCMTSFGYSYHEGLGVKQNYQLAKYWYDKAAEKGNGQAMNNLGWMYEKGNGIIQNYFTAIYWYEKACKVGNQQACENLKKLNK